MDDAGSESTAVPLDLLLQITDGFSEERKLGSGSFGEVYLGVHPDGQKIAVKKIYDMPGVDEEQFQNEFKNLARLQHRNIVRLVGYCHHIQEVPAMYEGKLVLAEKIHRALCLEYMSNGSLEKYISDECDKYDWHTGYGIIKGICQGLKYLHTKLEPPIYHLDLKPANILLDENMVPRIADFGISRLFGDERTRATKSTLGTQGYLPPEYIRNYLISSKFDIFSLGVVIIKIMAGRAGYYKSAEMSSHEFINVVQENWTNRPHETSSLMKAYSKQVKICIEIGLSCVQEDRHKRPTVQNIVDRLNETETECTCAYKKFEVQENSGGLTPNYFMNNGRSVSEVPLNNDAGPSIQARNAWQYPKDMTAQQELGERQAASLPNGIYEPPRQIMEGFPESGGTTTVERQDLAVRVQEAITDPFVVKDRRSALNGKSYPPSKEEAVHRMENVSLKGKRCNDLADKNITTVKRFMGHYHRDKSGLQKLKVKSWKLPAFKKFEERENSGVLIPDYLMMNGCPVRAVSLNNDAGPSVQARTIWQYPNDMAAQHVFSDRHPLNGFSRAAVLSNNGAGPSNQGTLPFSQPTYEQTVHQGNGQHDPSMAQNGIPDYLPQGNILNDQGSLSAQPTPFHNFLPVPADEMITGASLTDEQTEYFSTTDSLGTLENAIPGPELDISCDSPKSLLQAKNPLKQGNWRQLLGINTGDLKQVIIACGKAAAENDIHTEVLISELRQLVSISGDPMQRLGAYMLEGLVARFSSSGSKLYKSLKYKEPTSSELMSYMHLLYEMCPFYMFGYMSANGAIAEAIKGENFVHIIDFQIAQGSQWITIIQALAARSGGPPCLRITGIDDSNSAYARGGGLDMVGTRLHSVSASCGVPFEFNAVHAASHEVYLEHLDIRPGEVIVVNFAYQLHHTPDESVSTENHRDRIIRMIKSLAPRVVTLVEQESNTNTTPFFQRYLETLDYYTAIFEIIDVALPRDDKTRISTEQHCLARDIISLIACEGAERVERHEVFGKWKARFAMAGFRPYPLSSLVNNTIKTLLDGYHRCYRLEERDGVLYLGWKSRMLVVSSAWR
ncbi:hypothetical protein CFC21_079756 [Triticum aestivum]|uniref:Protein kinase domain-containing protein n=6 Tax=Triticum aestivum TaxID=4565 RepID=A0A3B6N039_WHEAT|nr:uncharacterized protein LOC123123027 isoform X1 [Triticum aestivum]KAF7074947.1 hypothetical protein CFC21_079756 [Triticum aestivum]